MGPKRAKPSSQISDTVLTLRVRVQPKASRNQIDGYQADTLRLRVTAPPEDGKANAAVVALLADTLGIAKSKIQIARGHSSRDKVIEVKDEIAEQMEVGAVVRSGAIYARLV